MVTMNLPLDEAQQKELEELARELKKPVAELAADAVRALLSRREALKAIDDGLQDAKAGRVVDGDAVKRWLASWGTDGETDPPT